MKRMSDQLCTYFTDDIKIKFQSYKQLFSSSNTSNTNIDRSSELNTMKLVALKFIVAAIFIFYYQLNLIEIIRIYNCPAYVKDEYRKKNLSWF